MKKQFSTRIAPILSSLIALAGLRACTMALPAKAIVVTPSTDAVFSSTRQVNALALADDGALWVATGGGVLQRSAVGMWRKWTRHEGLPSQEVLDVIIQDSNVTAIFPGSKAAFNGGKWVLDTESGKLSDQQLAEKEIQWRGTKWRGTLDGLLQESNQAVDSSSKQEVVPSRTFPLPPSKGTHISALMHCGDKLLIALFGDGLWQFDGVRWSRSTLNVPPSVTDITALAGDEKSLWVGTRRDGVWHSEAGQWQQFLQVDEPFEHNVQNMVSYVGALWFSTLEDGLIARTSAGWQQFGMEELSSMAPRQLVVWKDDLYVRHGGGRVDRYDGSRWERNVFPNLPRRKALFLTADKDRIYIVQWGGWSEWDGKTWQHFLTLPELQGLPLMNLLPDGDTTWIGTQSRGVIEIKWSVEAATPSSAIPDDSISKAPTHALPPSLPILRHQVTFHDERRGLSDDWITCMSRQNDTLWAGTFVGGLCRFDGKRWQAVKELAGQCITALETDGKNGLYIATRRGLWHYTAGNVVRLNDKADWLASEDQTLCCVPGGLWVGARTGVFFIADKSAKIAVGKAPQL